MTFFRLRLGRILRVLRRMLLGVHPLWFSFDLVLGYQMDPQSDLVRLAASELRGSPCGPACGGPEPL